MKTLILTLITLLAIGSQAQQLNAREISKLYYSARCDKDCQNGVSVDLYDSKNFFRLPVDVYKNLRAVAFDQAQIWGDTILEGDYVADGKTQLEQVLVIKQNSRLIGYAVSYSEKAWYTGDCVYSSKRPEALGTCEEGRIFERSFLTPDFKDAEVDQNQFADFKSND